MKTALMSHLTHGLHNEIEHYRLEPFIDLTCNHIVGYKVLSQLKHHVDTEQWFTRLSGRQQIDLLLEQINCVHESMAVTCFYNLSVIGFIYLTGVDIERISGFNHIALEISDSSLLKVLDRKEQYIFFKNTRRLQVRGVKIWVDDFCLDDLISLPLYQEKFDGIKIDRKDTRSPHLGEMIEIIKRIVGDIPVLIEGVESENDLVKGMRCGANLAQGYYWNDNNLKKNISEIITQNLT
ncbi:EAL domain-containing protein [Enterobacter asburiae]|uniref:EAL domain-containing protein n=1 Tax=Enterobacter asburiae TaxID=61645 RepID=UPI0018ED4CA5|nr:EAL domain-containing protein [Enterobacter asburiae]MBJ6588698.1 EAL domain-containing protein [Enterobacter asburiae]